MFNLLSLYCASVYDVDYNNESEFFSFPFLLKFFQFIVSLSPLLLLSSTVRISRRLPQKKSKHITERRCDFTASPARWWPLTCASLQTTSHPPSANEFLSTSTVSLHISDLLSWSLLFFSLVVLPLACISKWCAYNRDIHQRLFPRSHSGARFGKPLNSRPRSTDHHYLQSRLHYTV
jgi:hypothetical protein